MQEFWLQFKAEKDHLLRSMRMPYTNIADTSFSTYMDGDKAPDVYSPLHLVVQSLVSDYSVSFATHEFMVTVRRASALKRLSPCWGFRPDSSASSRLPVNLKAMLP